MGTGKTTAQMQDFDTFDTASWDIVLESNHDGQEATAVWFIDDGSDYPRLWYEWVSSNFEITFSENNAVDGVSISIYSFSTEYATTISFYYGFSAEAWWPIKISDDYVPDPIPTSPENWFAEFTSGSQSGYVYNVYDCIDGEPYDIIYLSSPPQAAFPQIGDGVKFYQTSTEVTGSPITTADGGTATINLENGSYIFTATKNGYYNTYGKFTVAGSTDTVSFTMSLLDNNAVFFGMNF
jgi:hypothetical protein